MGVEKESPESDQNSVKTPELCVSLMHGRAVDNLHLDSH